MEEENEKLFNYKYILNNLIPADDLHWNKEESKYSALSEKDIDAILLSCISQGIKNMDDCYSIVSWATTIKVGQILLKNFIEGKIRVSKIDENGEPYFISNN